MTTQPEERIDRTALPDETVIAHYRIAARAGSGGMGEVYKAYDTKLQRTVALKVLRPELLRDPDKVRRFIQEAKTASSLNHPAIVTVYEVGAAEVDGERVQYIAMEFVEGQPLRRRMTAMSLEASLELLRTVAEGMAVAHAAGVVHRDLKPDNIMLTASGQPKIVDFGIAKLVQPELSQGGEGETVTLDKTREGLVLGTVGYMSPEQIDGRPVDHRSDIFALGCILYELVSRRRAFSSSSVVGTLHQILTVDPPPLRQYAPSLPEDLERIVRRCLAKDPDLRYQSIKEVAIELQMLLRSQAQAATAVSSRRRWPRWIAAALAAIVLGGLIAAGAVLLTAPATDLGRYRFTPLATGPTYEGFPAWSPDGKSLAYIAEVSGILQVFVRSLDSPVATQVTRALRDCRDPFWDPNGQRIYYVSLAEDRDSLWSVGVGGGAPQLVTDNVYTAAISPDGKTMAMLRDADEPGTSGLSLWMSSPPGAEPKRYAQEPLASQRSSLGVLRFSPDNQKLGVWMGVPFPASEDRSSQSEEAYGGFWIVPWNQGEPRRVSFEHHSRRPYPFSWMPDSRHIVFGAEVNRQTVGLHLWTGDTLTGKDRPLTTSSGNEHYPAVSPDGKRIVFSTEEGDFDLLSIPFDAVAIRPLMATTRNEKGPVWSPTQGAFAYVTNRSGSEEIWLRSQDGEWDRPIVTAKEFDGEASTVLVGLAFSPDGQRIAYQRRGTKFFHIWISPIAGGRPVLLVPPGFGNYQDMGTWSPDGNSIAFVSTLPGNTFGLFRIKVGSGEKPVFVEKVMYPSNPQWSPRGDWITIDTSEGFSVISPDGATRRVLSETSFIEHTWSRDGSTIYGVTLSEDLHMVLVSVNVDTGTETELADLGPSPPVSRPLQGLSLAPDGKSLLTSMPRLKGDLWLLEGFDEPEGVVQKIASRFRR